MNKPTEITTARKEMVIGRELEMWQNTQCQAEIKHRVGKRLKDEVLIKEAVALATKCEIAIAEIMEIMEELPKAEGK